MTDLQNNIKTAFTLIEVVVALFIATIILSPLLILQMNNFKGVNHYSQVFLQMSHAKEFLAEKKISRQLDEEIPEKIDEPLENATDSILHYTAAKTSKKSSLKRIKNLYQEIVTIEWQGAFGPERETLISFFYQPERKKE